MLCQNNRVCGQLNVPSWADGNPSQCFLSWLSRTFPDWLAISQTEGPYHEPGSVGSSVPRSFYDRTGNICEFHSAGTQLPYEKKIFAKCRPMLAKSSFSIMLILTRLLVCCLGMSLDPPRLPFSPPIRNSFGGKELLLHGVPPPTRRDTRPISSVLLAHDHVLRSNYSA